MDTPYRRERSNRLVLVLAVGCCASSPGGDETVMSIIVTKQSQFHQQHQGSTLGGSQCVNWVVRLTQVMLLRYFFRLLIIHQPPIISPRFAGSDNPTDYCLLLNRCRSWLFSQHCTVHRLRYAFVVSHGRSLIHACVSANPICLVNPFRFQTSLL